MRPAHVFTLAAVLTALVLTGSAQEVRTKIDVAKVGPQVGQQVPEFTLPDQNGKVSTLQSIMGPKGAMLVFYRSADWCPYCKTQLLELQSQRVKLEKEGLGLVAISYDPQPILAAFSRQHGITYPLLSDLGSATIKRYGILNTVAEEVLGPNGSDPAIIAQARLYVSGNGATERMRGIPFPGTFIIDRQGRVTSRFFEDSYTVRNTVSNILLKLDGRDGSVTGTRISTEHLDLKTYSTDIAVAPGNRFSIALEITPRRGMHVYAPGASGYRVVGVTTVPQQFIRVLTTHYPASETWFFKPLNERVPVYQKPFTLVQEFVLDGQGSAREALRDHTTLMIAGTLEYQACDDRLCYNPVSVPLSWTVGLKPIITQQTIKPAQ